MSVANPQQHETDDYPLTTDLALERVLKFVRWLSEAVDAYVSWCKSTGLEAHPTTQSVNKPSVCHSTPITEIRVFLA